MRLIDNLGSVESRKAACNAYVIVLTNPAAISAPRILMFARQVRNRLERRYTIKAVLRILPHDSQNAALLLVRETWSLQVDAIYLNKQAESKSTASIKGSLSSSVSIAAKLHSVISEPKLPSS
jgi:hypothetical protein